MHACAHIVSIFKRIHHILHCQITRDVQPGIWKDTGLFGTHREATSTRCHAMFSSARFLTRALNTPFGKNSSYNSDAVLSNLSTNRSFLLIKNFEKAKGLQ
jgi:hypothetical protein